jgi:hypothetical protein
VAANAVPVYRIANEIHIFVVVLDLFAPGDDKRVRYTLDNFRMNAEIVLDLIHQVAFGRANTLVHHKQNAFCAASRRNQVVKDVIDGVESPAREVNRVVKFRSDRLVNGFHSSGDGE